MSLPVAFVLGVLGASFVGVPFPLSFLGGIVGAVLAFGVAIPVGLRSMRRAREMVPVDLGPGLPGHLSVAEYIALPLAFRNGVIARAVAQATGRSPEYVAQLLPTMMGRSRMANVGSQRAAAELTGDLISEQVDTELYSVVLEGELILAGRTAMPPNDRVRAIAERNFGQAVTESVMRDAISTTRFPNLGRVSVQELASGASDGDVDLAFAVGSIRKVAEKHAQGWTEF